MENHVENIAFFWRDVKKPPGQPRSGSERAVKTYARNIQRHLEQVRQAAEASLDYAHDNRILQDELTEILRHDSFSRAVLGPAQVDFLPMSIRNALLRYFKRRWG